jgi:enamine deaminase RidA (YjgF/YER057c/UK114 family)
MAALNQIIDSIRYVDPPKAGPAQGLYSHATIVPPATMAHIAGQLSIDRDGNVVGKGDVERQIRQVFANLKDVLAGLGLEYNHVVKFTTYLVHSQDIDIFMRVRAELFPQLFGGTRFPPNTLLIIDRLVKEDFLVEVEAVAVMEPTMSMKQAEPAR